MAGFGIKSVVLAGVGAWSLILFTDDGAPVREHFGNAIQNMTFSSVVEWVQSDRPAFIFDELYKSKMPHLFALAILFKLIANFFRRRVEAERALEEKEAAAEEKAKSGGKTKKKK